MAVKAFNSLAYARKLKESGVPEAQAEEQAEFMADAFEANIENLVTKDHLDYRLNELEVRVNAKFTMMYFMQSIILAAIVIPALAKII